MEPASVSRQDRRRTDLKFSGLLADGSQLYADVTVTNPTCASYVHDAAVVPGATAAKAAVSKVFPSYIYVRGRFIEVQEGERERPEGGTTLGRSEQRSGSGRSRRPCADLADFDGFQNGPASDDMIYV